jgi:putative addiction module component (TIGR02574 family)
LEEIKPSLARLKADEKAELAHYLIHALDDGEDADVEAAWESEIQRRTAEIEKGDIKGINAENVFNELRSKYS